MTNSRSRKLMLISSDRISEWIKKGEVTPRYYNPGNVFSEVHLVLLNDETLEKKTLNILVGNAQVFIYTFPTGIFHYVKTLFWSPFLLKGWSKPIVDLARSIRPDLVRCHGALLNGYLAREIKRELGIPYVISLHINYDTDVRGRKMGLLKRVRDLSYKTFEGNVLRDANKVLPVYKPIIAYLNRHHVQNFEVAYNFLNINSLGKKECYDLGKPIRIVSVGRQFKEKNPENLIRAVLNLPQVELTLVGDGAYHENLKNVVGELGLESRVHFVPAMPNDQVCKLLPTFDIFATHTEYWEISKSILEALLTGLPVLLNTRRGEPVPELNEAPICHFVEDTPQGFQKGLEQLIKNQDFREGLGRRAFEYSRHRWDPARTEKKFVDVYESVIQH